jgi:hypothetical protein
MQMHAVAWTQTFVLLALKFAGGMLSVGLAKRKTKVWGKSCQNAVESDRLVVGIADWLIHREMGCDSLVTNMKRFKKIRIYLNGIINAYNMHIVKYFVKPNDN